MTSARLANTSAADTIAHGANGQSRCRRRGATLLVMTMLLGIPLPVGATEPGTVPVGRATVDRDRDLLHAFLDTGRYEEARSLGQTRLRATSSGSLEQRLWTARLVQVETASAISNGPVNDAQIATLQTPLTDLLRMQLAPADELLIRFELLEVLRQACVQDCIAASTLSSDSEVVLRAAARAAKVAGDSNSLIEAVDQELTRAEHDLSNPSGSALSRDLSELAQRLRVQAVQTLLMLADVFAEGTPDQRDAASKALRYAESSLESIAPQSAGWFEVQLLRAEAMLRSGNLRQATELVEQLATASDSQIASPLLATRVRIAIADERWNDAAKQLTEHFGSEPESAPLGFELDLVRLKFLLSMTAVPEAEIKRLGMAPEDLDPAIQRWVDAIESRYGLFERRRAEAMILRKLGESRSDPRQPSQTLQPGLVASQGEDWLRRGNPQRASELLASAALAETTSVRAISHATKAAAAYLASGDPFKAASILYQVAILHPGDVGAAPLALQAAMLLQETGEARHDAQIDVMLRKLLELWPASTHAPGARKWLTDRLSRQQRWIDAADVATSLPEAEWTEASAAAIVSLWKLASMRVPLDQLEDLSDRFQQAFEPISSQPVIQKAYHEVAPFALSRDDLRSFAASDDPLAPDAHASRTQALVRFRQLLEVPVELKTAPDSDYDAIVNRLMNDGRLDPSCRAPVAELIESWEERDEASFDRVQRLTWLGRLDQARAVANRLVTESKQPGQLLRSLASQFESAGNRDAQREAAAWWDKLASGIPRGEPGWHDAKLRAAETLLRAGERDEAAKRARYVLLTQPPADATLRQRYESLAGGASR